jgi:hypothetical protein
MGMNSFGPFPKLNTSFIVQNIITKDNKTVRIFNNPIPVGCQRDLLAIEGVGESEIRISLLKGEILHKLLAQEITIVFSDIDLLQFNAQQLAFLEASGITIGLQVGSAQSNVLWNQDIELVGTIDGTNTTFTIPSGTWIQNSIYKIVVYKNGVKQVYLDDYIIAEGGGVGTGYNTVIFTVPPSPTPLPPDVMTADYYTDNTNPV